MVVSDWLYDVKNVNLLIPTTTFVFSVNPEWLSDDYNLL